MQNQPFFQCTGMSKGQNIRSIRIPKTNDVLTTLDSGADMAPPWDEGFYILAKGCAANANVAQIELNYSCEFTASAEYIQVCPMQYAKPGIQTLQCITNMMMEFPQLQRLRQEQSDDLCEALSAASPGTHDSVLKQLG